MSPSCEGDTGPSPLRGHPLPRHRTPDSPLACGLPRVVLRAPVSAFGHALRHVPVSFRYTTCITRTAVPRSFPVALYRLTCIALALLAWSLLALIPGAIVLTGIAAFAAVVNPRRLAQQLALRRVKSAPAIASAATEAAAPFDQGYALYRGGRTDAAIVLLREAIARDESDIDAFFYLGCALADLGRDAAAATALERVVLARPAHADAHATLGMLHERGGRRDAARAAYQEALRLKPQLSAVRRALSALDGPRGVRVPRLSGPRGTGQFGPRAA